MHSADRSQTTYKAKSICLPWATGVSSDEELDVFDLGGKEGSGVVTSLFEFPDPWTAVFILPSEGLAVVAGSAANGSIISSRFFAFLVELEILQHGHRTLYAMFDMAWLTNITHTHPLKDSPHHSSLSVSHLSIYSVTDLPCLPDAFIYSSIHSHPIPDNKVHVANMGPIWGRQDPGGPHVGSGNFRLPGIITLVALPLTDSFIQPIIVNLLTGTVSHGLNMDLYLTLTD